MAAAEPDVLYLDDPTDGASKYVLESLGVTLFRGQCKTSDIAQNVFRLRASSSSTSSPIQSLDTTTQDRIWSTEHSSNIPMLLVASNGGAYVDVRDVVGAWIRIVLRDGDGVYLSGKDSSSSESSSSKKSTTRRIVIPDVFGNPAPVPVYPDNVDRDSRMTTVMRKTTVAPVPQAGKVTAFLIVSTPETSLSTSTSSLLLSFLTQLYPPGSSLEIEANRPHFTKPGTPHIRNVVVDLCESFYHLGWVTGTGGSISIRHGSRIFMAPSGVQKERMQPQDIFVLDSIGQQLYAPAPLLGKPRLKLSQCAPLFQHAFTLRKAGACIHTHDMNAVLVTLLAGNETEFRITHQEMIKGIEGHGFVDMCVIPIIENTPHECDLADSLGEAMRRYPRANAVLVRRHGVYVWGESWEAAKTQAECYHYLFEAAVRMRGIGLDPSHVPVRVENGIGAERAYGSGLENAGGYGSVRTAVPGATGAGAIAGHATGCACCSSSPPSAVVAAAVAVTATSTSTTTTTSAALGEGFHGTAGTSTIAVSTSSIHSALPPQPLARLADYSCVVLDVEGCTTSIQFVVDTLFPYAEAHVREWLSANWTTQVAKQDIEALIAQSTEDNAGGGNREQLSGAKAVQVTASQHTPTSATTASEKEKALDALVANVKWQMRANRKTGALKQLQGHIWAAGYQNGTLRGHMFDDTVPALELWKSAQKKCYIYSSGSREAQRLLFKYSEKGDLRPLLSGYFDTKVGMKIVPTSYTDIVATLGVDSPSQVLFATDSMAEAVAAAQAGLRVVVTDRPGNAVLPASHPFPVATSLLDVAKNA